MVLSRKYIQPMEIHWLLIVDTRKTCVILGFQRAMAPDHSHFYSRFRENCALVRLSSTLCPCETNIISLAPQS